MPTVYLPLGSQAASGAMGEMFVYQGVVVRRWVVPRDPRTNAQVDVRHLFFDITKTIKSMGAWARAACKSQFGPRWFTLSYAMVRATMFEPDPVFHATSAEIWDTWTEEQQTTWGEAAPFKATWSEPGFIFWSVYFGLQESFGGGCELPVYSGGYIDPPVTWWAKTLGGVSGIGVFDNGTGLAEFSGVWTEDSEELAFGGTFLKAYGGGAAAFTFTFYGKQATLVFLKSSWGGMLDITVDGGARVRVNQYAATYLWQSTWSTGILATGLHIVTCEKVSGTEPNIDEIIITSPKAAPGVPVVEGAEFEIGVLEMLEQTVQPTTPAITSSKLYFSADGLLHVLDSSGAPVTITAEALTQAAADLRYLQTVPQQDHGGLSGLADDDHSQYYNQTRGDARYLQLGNIVDVLGAINYLGTLIPGSTTWYMWPFGNMIGTSFNVAWPVAGTLKKMYLRILTAQPANNSLVVTLLINNASTALVITVSAGGAAGVYSNLTHEVTISAGDLVKFECKNNANVNSASVGSITLLMY